MENITEQMLDQDDIKGRLRLFRYGLIVIVVVAFLLSWLMPYAMFLLVGWSVMLIVWYLLGLPVGPDSPIHVPG